jgi:hypothetical protein
MNDGRLDRAWVRPGIVLLCALTYAFNAQHPAFAQDTGVEEGSTVVPDSDPDDAGDSLQPHVMDRSAAEGSATEGSTTEGSASEGSGEPMTRRQLRRANPWRTTWVPLPALAYTPETSLQFGGFLYATWRRPTFPAAAPSSAYGGNVLYTLRRQVIVEAFGTIIFPGWRWELQNSITARDFPDNYYGLGNDTSLDDKEIYRLREITLENDLRWRFDPRMYAVLIQRMTLRDTSVEDPAESALAELNPNGFGRDGGFGLGLGWAWDTRDHKIDTFRGAFAQLSALAWPGFLGTTHPFVRLEADLRAFVTPGGPHRFGFQLLSQNTIGEPSFTNLTLLGGGDIMRGIYTGRFRDQHLLAAQTEYRWTIWGPIGIAAFAGVGQVMHSWRDFRFPGFKYSVGGGLRWAFDRDDRVNLRFDFGAGPDSTGFYINVREAF